MAIISCPECGKQVSDRAISCPECGFPINGTQAIPVQSNAEDVSKLLLLARRAREGSDSVNAKKYYDQILEKSPGCWEAIFYSVYYNALECKIMHISSAANSVANCIYSTFSAINDLQNDEEKDSALTDVIFSSVAIASAFVSSAVGHYNKFSTTDGAFSECSNRVVASGNIYAEIEASLKNVFPEEKVRLANLQKLYATFLVNNSRWYNNTYFSNTRARLDNEITSVYPEHGKRRELEQKISALNVQINSLVTERTAKAGCLGWFFVICGIIMFTVGLVLWDMTDASWALWVSILELIIGALCLVKTPSQEEVDSNIKKKKELTAERDALQAELDSL